MLAAGTAALLAGCSDASRFSSDPFADPFARAPSSTSRSPRTVDRSSTGAIPGGSNSTRVQSQPLAPPTKDASAPHPASVANAAPGSYNHWSPEGGTPITVGAGENPAILANRYGVPTDVLLKVNGFASSSQVQPGTRLIIPVYRSTGAKTQLAAEAHPSKEAREESKPAPKRVAAKADTEEKETSAPKASRKSAQSPVAKSAKLAKADDKQEAAPRKAQDPKAKALEKKAKVAVKSDGEDEKAGAKPKAKPQPKVANAEPAEASAPEKRAAKTEKREQPQVAANDPPVDHAPVGERKVDRSMTTAAIPPAQEVKVSDAAHPEFRWPARGRIIQGFSNGGNDGINIAVPEGTQVKAAEAGVVAYAGNELKGYGNLVLIRHPNGFVTAYAHNGDITVKRGDQVTRGQTIAKSGQTGNVASPQLHFELRKGSTPVDPTGYLAAGL
jgi:murein DD-endopeptidase MepM/ murein hydrolase activator NlpD